jgi:hypothetical protein
MSGILPTVTVKTKNGPVEINLSDYDPKEHTLVGGSVESKPEFTVGKNGKRGAASKFVILNADGERHGEDEFDSKEEAEAAIENMVG